MAALTPMPFLSGPAVTKSEEPVPNAEPAGEFSALIPLSKVQQALWLDYLRRPHASHYHLTLSVDLTEAAPTLDQILKVINDLAQQHDMLRTTFHFDHASGDISQSYMAVHTTGSDSFQNFEIVQDQASLVAALRRSFNLSSQFPVRWVIMQKMSMDNHGALQIGYDLYVVGHHIAIDGASMSYLSQCILQQLKPQSDSSAGTTSGASVSRSLTYGQFVQKQDALLKGPGGKAARDFWLSQLSNVAPFDWNVRTDPSGATPCSNDNRVMNTWAFFPNEELAAWSNQYKTSWFRIAFAIVSLITAGNSQPTPHHDHTLHLALGGRPRGFEGCVSHMANTMPIKTPLSSLLQRRATFAQAVKEIGRSVSTAKKHEMFPFVSLIDEARKTMGDDTFDFKVAVTFSPKLASDKCTLYPVEGVWDLFFCFLENDDGVSLGVITDPKVFDPASVEGMKKQFLDTVKLSQETSGLHLDELSYLQNRNTAHIVSGPKIDAVDNISASRVHGWIEARAAVQPNAIALSCGERGEQMTYAELDRKTNQIAHYLGDGCGIKAGDVVAVHIQRGFGTLLWIIGVLKAGGCFVVLDKGLPISRKQAIIGVCEASHLVTDTGAVDELLVTVDVSPLHVTRLDVATFADEISKYPETHFVEASADQDLAYMVFTSGSTGQPKGIMVEHANLSHYVSAARSLVDIGPGSKVLQFASFTFDASILEWAVSLSYGATLCFVEHPSLLVGDYLADVLKLNQINFFHTTPSVLSTIPLTRRLPHLRLISVGGEPSSAGLLGRWRQRVKLLHAYGPTETTVIVTSEPIPQNTSEDAELPSPSVIGKSFPNSEILICSEDSETPVPAGEIGEICIFGPQVSRGYKGQEDLTAAKFRSVQLHGKAGRLYRTGDRGSMTADGKLMIGGRMNNREIKLRGYRMDLYEIEKSILDHSTEVMLASVQVAGDSLVAFLVPATVDCDAVRARLLEDVPSYCVPTNIHAVSELPLNPNGKVDHSKVKVTSLVSDRQPVAAIGFKQPAQTRRNISDVDDPNGSLTLAVTQIWAEVLAVSKPPAVDMNFFDAGGHSLLLMTLHKRINERFPTAGLRLLDVFHHATIEKQAAHLFKLLDVENAGLPMSTISDSSEGTSSREDSTAATTPKTSASLHSLDHYVDKFAIVGLAGRFPGADDVNEFWDLLMEQRDGITTTERFQDQLDVDMDEDEAFVPRFGSINGLDDFKPSAWGLSEEEASTMDPQKRIFLGVASEALKDARVELSKKTENNVGVFVGAAANSYQYDPTTPLPSSAFDRRYRTVLDENISTFASYKLNLTGPNLTINTACASSLVALHVGVNALRSGECDTALIGGTSVVYPQEGGYITSPGRVFAASGECRPFDARSDGSVPADAVAGVVVKPLHAAVRDGNTIYSVIEGHAIGTDGALDKVGFVVPSSTGQARTITNAIRTSGVSAETIKYVEMHGSGTSMGDALELDGLSMAFDAVNTVDRGHHHVYVGSNKGNCGNAETASGLLSVIKASLALSRGVVPPLRELEKTNPSCDFTGRFRPLTGALKLATQDRIGVTSLGYGGTNAHVVLASATASGGL